MKIYEIVLESESGTTLRTCIEASFWSDALNEAFKKHGKIFTRLKSLI